MGSNSLCTHGERGTRGKRHWGRKGLGRGRGIGRARNGAVRSAGVTLEAAGGRIQHWIQRAWVSPVESECQQAKPSRKRGRGRKGGRVGIGGGHGTQSKLSGSQVGGRNPPTGGMGGYPGQGQRDYELRQNCLLAASRHTRGGALSQAPKWVVVMAPLSWYTASPEKQLL